MRRIEVMLVLAAALALACLSGLAFAPNAYATKQDDTLRFASNFEPENIDLYYNNVREGIVLARLIWDQLLWRNPATGKYEGMLAKSYRWTNPTTLDFELRQGIQFHNGEKFDADDVVFTLNFVSDPANKVLTFSNVSWIKNAEKRGPYSVRINLKTPFPAALEYLAGPIPIYPNEYYAAVGPKGMRDKPIGTGPYKVTEIQYGKVMRFSKNPNYFKESPQGQPSIGNIEFRLIPEPNTQMAELMAGGLDWLWRVQADALPNLAQNPAFQVLASETMRVAFISYESDNHSDSPTNKQKVREAINHAVNRESIRKNLIGGVTRVVDAPCFPGQFGCVDKGVRKFAYDPALAKKLLAEAGYPNGFAIDFYTYATYDRPYVEAIVGDLRAVGIEANLRAYTYATWRDEVRAGRAKLYYGSWGSNSVYDVSAIDGYYFKFGPDDTTRDSELRDWLEAGDTSIDPKVRLQNYAQAMKRVAERAYWLPCFTYSLNYAFTKELDFTAHVDEIPRFVNSRWK